MFNPLLFTDKMHICHILFIILSSYIPDSGRYIGEISKSALISVKILLISWQIVGNNQNFCPAVNQTYF